MVGIYPPYQYMGHPPPPVSPPYRGFWRSKTPHNANDKIFWKFFPKTRPPYILKVGKLEKKFFVFMVK